MIFDTVTKEYENVMNSNVAKHRVVNNREDRLIFRTVVNKSRGTFAKFRHRAEYSPLTLHRFSRPLIQILQF